MLWGREAMAGYNFTFAKDGFVSVEVCGGKNQSSSTVTICISVKRVSFILTHLKLSTFNNFQMSENRGAYTHVFSFEFERHCSRFPVCFLSRFLLPPSEQCRILFF
jgi:hypothetical protein